MELLVKLEDIRQDMIDAVKRTIQEVLFVQGMLIFCSSWGQKSYLRYLCSQSYIYIFYVDVIGVQLQLGFMSILAYLYYLDRQKEGSTSIHL